MSFDTLIDWRGTHSAKWDSMESVYGISPDEGLAMWVAVMDFRPPKVVQDAVLDLHTKAAYGYYGNKGGYHDAIRWWMAERHGWQVEADQIFDTHGLVNGTAMCIDTYTNPGDGVVLFTPVYHAFARVIKAAGREVVECPLVNDGGRYSFDFDAYDAQMTGNERMVVLCSPHNPGGRVWTKGELQAVAAFAKRHELTLVSDEIHCDLTMPGQVHIPMALIDGISDRLVMMTAASKTFNIAGAHVGNVIIPDADLRAPFARRMMAMGMSPNSFGVHMVTAAYSPEGAAWVDELRSYLDGNRKVFDAGVNAIPGLHSMDLEATYLAWVDFAGTGMTQAEFIARVEGRAKIAANHGDTFGSGGESFLRFNLGAPRSVIEDAVRRLQDAFSDLQ
ncbi:MalY/PatB family protein [Flavimaricola marinus]|uniref:cysteine-S-conjugate beta-lyase n=1 Tax=Flavimaricola marinus TaxID=1819565 RepID=A0A238LAA3_9RHOB|nr:PatB family C-S lyase [Flavimaricola marinus]SMY06493.1 Cystathionine beta-lyase PatB [Flavimaricola marinus]